MKKYYVLLAHLLLALLIILAPAGCNSNDLPVDNNREEPSVNDREVENGVALPAPAIEEGSVAEALNYRLSVRNFSDQPLDQDQAAALLWAAVGMKVDGQTGPTRTIPSAGGTYPLELYLLAGNVEGIEPGVYRYDYENHALQPMLLEDRRELLAEAALDQGFIAEAPVVLVLTAHYERTTGRYGDRGIRYVLIDAGHASQSISLQAVELGLGSVVIGAFEDQKVAEILAVEGEPLLILPVGVPGQ